jgi:hypothetical protein
MYPRSPLHRATHGQPSVPTHMAYMDESYGPKRCDLCRFYPAPNTCDNEKIVADAHQGLYNLRVHPNGLAVVQPGGCSDEFWPREGPHAK